VIANSKINSRISNKQLFELIKSIQINETVDYSFQQIIDHYDNNIKQLWDDEAKKMFNKGSEYKCKIVGQKLSYDKDEVDPSKKVPFNSYLSCVHFGLMLACLRFNLNKSTDLWNYALRFIKSNINKEVLNYPPASGVFNFIGCNYLDVSAKKLINEYTCDNRCQGDSKFGKKPFDYVNIFVNLTPCKRKPQVDIIDLDRDRNILNNIYERMDDGDEEKKYEQNPEVEFESVDYSIYTELDYIDSRLLTQNGQKQIKSSIILLPKALRSVIKDLVAPSRKVKSDSTSYVKKKYRLTQRSIDLMVMEAVKIIKSNS
jgi:hypothetical protein